MVARGGIEPPTRGFSVQVPKRAKCLTALRSLSRKCPIFFRDTATYPAESSRNDQIILDAQRDDSRSDSAACPPSTKPFTASGTAPRQSRRTPGAVAPDVLRRGLLVIVSP